MDVEAIGSLLEQPNPGRFTVTQQARFWSRVDVRKDNECWEWRGNVTSKGYGQHSIRAHKTFTFIAHRVAFWLVAGREPGPVLDHLCRNRACCNPRHLEEVDTRENILRGIGPCAVNAKKSTCLKGHPLSGPNLKIVRPKGRPQFRVCRECEANNRRAWKARAHLKEINDVTG